MLTRRWEGRRPGDAQHRRGGRSPPKPSAGRFGLRPGACALQAVFAPGGFLPGRGGGWGGDWGGVGGRGGPQARRRKAPAARAEPVRPPERRAACGPEPGPVHNPRPGGEQ